MFDLKVENAKGYKAIYIHTYYMFTRGRFYNSEYYVKSVIQTELGIAFRTQQSKEWHCPSGKGNDLKEVKLGWDLNWWVSGKWPWGMM